MSRNPVELDLAGSVSRVESINSKNKLVEQSRAAVRGSKKVAQSKE